MNAGQRPSEEQPTAATPSEGKPSADLPLGEHGVPDGIFDGQTNAIARPALNKPTDTSQSLFQPNWFHILTAVFNVRIVANSAASLVGSLLGLNFVLVCVVLVSLILVQFRAVPQVAGLVNILTALFSLYWTSLFFRKLFRVTTCSAHGSVDTDTKKESRGLIYYVCFVVLASIIVSPVVYLSIPAWEHLIQRQPLTVGMWVSLAGMAVAILFFPVFFVRVTLTGSFNPLKAFQWLLKCPVGFTIVLLAAGLWTIVHFVVAGLCAGAVLIGALYLVDVIPDDVQALEQELAAVAQVDNEQLEPLPTRDSNAPYGERTFNFLQRVQKHPQLVETAKRKIVARITFETGGWFFQGLAVAIHLVVAYFYLHATFTAAHMLGLFARKRQERLGWKVT